MIVRRVEFYARTERAELYKKAAQVVNGLGDARDFEVRLDVASDVTEVDIGRKVVRHVGSTVTLAFLSAEEIPRDQLPSWSDCRRQLDETILELSSTAKHC